MAVNSALNLINSYSNQFAAGAANAGADKELLRSIRNQYARIAREHKWEEEKANIHIDEKEGTLKDIGQQSRELAKSA